MSAFISPGAPIPGPGKTFGDFWSWAYSDILSNSNRSVFAEYLVGLALNAIERPRVEWDRCDLRYRGKLIEVKASAYVQSWPQNKPSPIGFDIGKHLGWDAATNSSSPESIRCADCYVFCVFADRERAACDVTDPARWRFYVVSRELLDSHFGAQRTARLSSIERVASSVRFEAVRAAVDEVISALPDIHR